VLFGEAYWREVAGAIMAFDQRVEVNPTSRCSASPTTRRGSRTRLAHGLVVGGRNPETVPPHP
jgi:hypothetical protein